MEYTAKANLGKKRDFVLQYILNDTEVQEKTAGWLKQNAEYLQEQKGQSLYRRRCG